MTITIENKKKELNLKVSVTPAIVVVNVMAWLLTMALLFTIILLLI